MSQVKNAVVSNKVRSKRKLFVVLFFALSVFCIFLIGSILVFRGAFLSSTPIPTEAIWNLDSYNAEIKNVSELVTISNIWITPNGGTGVASLTDDLHISISNNSRWTIQIAKIILGDQPDFFNRIDQKIERPFNYSSAYFCQYAKKPNIIVVDNLPQAPGYDMSVYHFGIPGQGAFSAAEYKCEVIETFSITANDKICVVFYPLSKYSFETFNYVYREYYYSTNPEWEKAFDEFRLITICNK